MRKNTENIFNAWKSGYVVEGNSISTDGATIRSYTTPILFRENKVLKLNVQKYSKTTSRQQSDLKGLLSRENMEFEEVN